MSDTPENTEKRSEMRYSEDRPDLWTDSNGPNPPPISPGRPKLTEEEKAARKAARREIVRWQEYKGMTVEQIKDLDLSTLPLVDVLMIRKLKKDLNDINTDELHKMYTRQLGSPKPDSDITTGLNITGSKVTIRIASGPTKDSEDGA